MEPTIAKEIPMKESLEVAVPQDSQQFNIQSLISQAIDKNVSADVMERMLAVAKEMDRIFAKKQFDQAMASFQRVLPTIKKTKEVFDKYGKLRYKFAPLDAIVEQVKDVLGSCNLSYTIDTKVEGENVTAIVKITHVDGHSETSSFTIPIDPQSFMTNQQKFASALTYGKRYAFCNALGILTGDEDDDANIAETARDAAQPHVQGQSTSKPPITPQRAESGSTSPMPSGVGYVRPSPKQFEFIENLMQSKHIPIDKIPYKFSELTGGKGGTASELIEWLKLQPYANGIKSNAAIDRDTLPTIQQQDDESIRKFNEEMGNIGNSIN